MKAEVWKPVMGYEGRYEVSDRGRVRNSAGHVLASHPQNSGYQIVHLYSGGKSTRKPKTVHRLVATAFLRDARPGEVTNHKDGDKSNNRVENLEWVSQSENNTHAFLTGLTAPPRKAVIGTSKSDGHTVAFQCQRDAEIALSGKATSAIHNCLSGKRKSAFGYTWSRA